MVDFNNFTEHSPLQEEESEKSSSSWWKNIDFRALYSGIFALIFVLFFIFLGWHGVALVDGFHLAGG